MNMKSAGVISSLCLMLLMVTIIFFTLNSCDRFRPLTEEEWDAKHKPKPHVPYDPTEGGWVLDRSDDFSSSSRPSGFGIISGTGISLDLDLQQLNFSSDTHGQTGMYSTSGLSLNPSKSYKICIDLVTNESSSCDVELLIGNPNPPNNFLLADINPNSIGMNHTGGSYNYKTHNKSNLAGYTFELIIQGTNATARIVKKTNKKDIVSYNITVNTDDYNTLDVVLMPFTQWFPPPDATVSLDNYRVYIK